MTGPGGIEFLDPDPDHDGHDEKDTLDTGPRRPVPRWAIGLATLAVAVVLAVVLTINSGGTPTAAASSAHPAPTTPQHPRPTTPAPFTPSAPASSSTRAVFVPGGRLVGRVLTLTHGPIQAMTFSRGGVAVLEPGHLTVINPVTGTRVRRATVVQEIGAPGLGPWRLFANGATVWAVGNGRVYRFSPGGTTISVSADPHARSHTLGSAGAALLDGRLYVADATGVYVVGPHAKRATRALQLSGIGAVVADPARHRLLILVRDRRTVVARAYTPHGSDLSKASAGLPINVGSGSLAAARSGIWAIGYNNTHGRVLVRLDPTTLNPISSIPAAEKRISSGATLAESGQTDFWLRGASGLWCMTSTGTPAQNWPFSPDVVISRTAPPQAFAAIGNQVAYLRLNNACTG